jgi:hypothetical protein
MRKFAGTEKAFGRRLGLAMVGVAVAMIFRGPGALECFGEIMGIGHSDAASVRKIALNSTLNR